MKLKYEYKGDDYEMNIKSLEKLEGYFKMSLKRKLNISINEYLVYLGFDIENCRICGNENVPVNLNISIIGGFIKINNFNILKKKPINLTHSIPQPPLGTTAN
jgi:hypothetical protein